MACSCDALALSVVLTARRPSAVRVPKSGSPAVRALCQLEVQTKEEIDR